MTKPLGERLYEVRTTLQEIERELAKGGMEEQDLADFKSVVDHVRLSVWAVMTAGWSNEYKGLDSLITKQIIARFRLTRAEELLGNAVSDVEGGVIPADSPELEQFYSALQETVGRVSRVIGSDREN